VAIAASLLMVPLAAAADQPWQLSLTAPAAVAVVFLGIVSTGIATVVYFRLISLAGPSFLSLINYLIPIWAMGLGVVALGERPGWPALVALVLVLLGIALSEMSSAGPARRPGEGS
jgi:drug/metabolite transporter (DMT)-like permease